MNSAIPHLLPETLPMGARLHVLRQLRRRHDQGCREPALLYSAARFATSLGLAHEAEKFLEPLLSALESDGQPSHASFGPLLLALHLAPGTPARTAQAETLADSTESLHNGWNHYCGKAYDGRPMPHSLLEHMRATPAMVRAETAALLDRAWKAALPDAVRALHAAASSYAAAHLDETRASLEEVLDDGTPAATEVLRTLVAVTSELQDHAGLERYWRRYVKMLLWSWIIRNDHAALLELARFYRTTAAATDRPFAASGGQPVSDLVRSPGLVARWLESHAALVWISAANPAANRTFFPVVDDDDPDSPQHLRRLWFQTFYPEFASSVSAIPIPSVPPPPRLSDDERKLDPAWRLLSRFAEWSKFNFAIRPEDSIDSPHYQMMLALAAMAARIPTAAHVKALLGVLKADDLAATTFRSIWQDAVSTPLHILLNRHCKEDKWQEACAAGEGLVPDHHASPGMLALRAFAHLQDDQEPQAMAIMLKALPSFEAEHLEADPAKIFKAAARAMAKSYIEERDQPGTDRRERIQDLIHRVQTAPAPPVATALVAECVDELTTVLNEMHIEDLIEEVMKAVKKGVEDDDYDAAERAVARLPDEPSRCLDLRKNLEKQVRDIRAKHEERQRLEKLWKQVLEKVKSCVAKGDFPGARTAIARLPDAPPDIKEGKESLSRQVAEAATEWAAAERENPGLLRTIRGRNVDMFKLANLAKENGIDSNNAAEYNAFLKAVIKSLDK